MSALRVIALCLVVLTAIAGFVYLVAFTVDHNLAAFGLFIVAYEGASALHCTAKASEDKSDDDLDDEVMIEATRERVT